MSRTAKNKVSIVNNRGNIRLYWRYNSSPYYVSPGLRYIPENVLLLKSVKKSIEKDLKQGKFDISLQKYIIACKELIQTDKDPDSPLVVEVKVNPIVLDFEHWTKNYRHKDCDVNCHYNATRNLLKRWKKFRLEDVVPLLNNENFSPKTYNNRLDLLKAFFEWGVRSRNYYLNPVEDVQGKKVIKTVNPKRLPLSDDEVRSILDAIKNNTHSNPASSYPHSHYYPFIYFILSTGVRNAEAVGLRVKHVDLKNNQIVIEEALARVLSNTHGSARIRKETKNGKVRKIPLNRKLKKVLLPLLQGKQPDDLVFLSFRGLPIDDRAFQRRVFRPVLKALKIAERHLYAGRHTVTSKYMSANINPVTVAYIMGNSPVTALKHYTHVTELPKNLPTF